MLDGHLCRRTACKLLWFGAVLFFLVEVFVVEYGFI